MSDDAMSRRLTAEAAELRACARDLRTKKAHVGALLDKAYASATAADLWRGPAADQVVAHLRSLRDEMHRAAEDVEATARVWDTHAASRETDAAAIRKALDRVQKAG